MSLAQCVVLTKENEDDQGEPPGFPRWVAREKRRRRGLPYYCLKQRHACPAATHGVPTMRPSRSRSLHRGWCVAVVAMHGCLLLYTLTEPISSAASLNGCLGRYPTGRGYDLAMRAQPGLRSPHLNHAAGQHAPSQAESHDDYTHTMGTLVTSRR